MSVFQGDFLGFTLGSIHSSQLNITRVSSGDRYEDGLIPNLKDLVQEVPGGDGNYYFGTFYNQKPFLLNFAYDDLRDEDLRKLRQVFGFKGIQQLIFDEFPYKKYLVKASSPPNFKYICFDHLETRLYKGEGTASLIAYYPYAFATFSPTIENNAMASINNVGDLDAKIELIYDINIAPNLSTIELFNSENNNIGKLEFNNIYQLGDNRIGLDEYILINSKTHLIEGLDENFQKTGRLYNRFIKSGDFFDAPPGRTELVSDVQFTKVQYTPLYY